MHDGFSSVLSEMKAAGKTTPSDKQTLRRRSHSRTQLPTNRRYFRPWVPRRRVQPKPRFGGSTFSCKGVATTRTTFRNDSAAASSRASCWSSEPHTRVRGLSFSSIGHVSFPVTNAGFTNLTLPIDDGQKKRAARSLRPAMTTLIPPCRQKVSVTFNASSSRSWASSMARSMASSDSR